MSVQTPVRCVARHDSRTSYSQFALGGRRLDQIVHEQLNPALAPEPTLASFHAGGNDLLMTPPDQNAPMRNRLSSRLSVRGPALT